jgi:shikimate kinase
LVGPTKNPSPEFLELFRKRQKVYSRADIRVLTDDRTPTQSCKILLMKLKNTRSSDRRPFHARSK